MYKKWDVNLKSLNLKIGDLISNPWVENLRWRSQILAWKIYNPWRHSHTETHRKHGYSDPVRASGSLRWRNADDDLEMRRKNVFLCGHVSWKESRHKAQRPKNKYKKKQKTKQVRTLCLSYIHLSVKTSNILCCTLKKCFHTLKFYICVCVPRGTHTSGMRLANQLLSSLELCTLSEKHQTC